MEGGIEMSNQLYMDPSLFNAARDGNAETLLDLLRADPLILERLSAATTTTTDTPLHVAAMLGHLEFVKTLLSHKTNPAGYVHELNQHGFSAAHLAAANGHADIMMCLLNVSPEICCLQGRDGVTPLHCALIKGRGEIITQILKVSPTCVSVVNMRGENALHLAVKNNQSGAFELLVGGLEEYEILNAQDYEGNSVLHLAAARRNHQTLEFLLKCNPLIPQGLSVNALNQSGLTPLDLVQLCPCESNYNDVERLLSRAGGVKACDLNNITQNSGISSQVPAKVEGALPPREKIFSWQNYFKFDFNTTKPETTRTDLLVLTVLMATATFQAILSPPGGLQDKDSQKGQAVLATTGRVSFAVFMFFNTTGFFTSLNMIKVMTVTYPMFWDLYVAMYAMVITYGCAMVTICPPGGLQYFAIVLATVLPIGIPFVSDRVRKYIKQHHLFMYKQANSTNNANV